MWTGGRADRQTDITKLRTFKKKPTIYPSSKLGLKPHPNLRCYSSVIECWIRYMECGSMEKREQTRLQLSIKVKQNFNNILFL